MFSYNIISLFCQYVLFYIILNFNIIACLHALIMLIIHSLHWLITCFADI